MSYESSVISSIYPQFLENNVNRFCKRFITYSKNIAFVRKSQKLQLIQIIIGLMLVILKNK